MLVAIPLNKVISAHMVGLELNFSTPYFITPVAVDARGVRLN